MSQIYDEDNQIDDLNVEADRVIAMNPSGIIEKFNGNEENKKYKCTGDSCIMSFDDDNYENGSKQNITNNIIYFIIFLALCVIGYFLYKKYSHCNA